MDTFSSLTASEARQNFYSLIKDVSRGLRSYEIRLRGKEPVVIVNKKELDSWLETLDILSSPEELKKLRLAKKEKRLVPHKQALEELGIS